MTQSTSAPKCIFIELLGRYEWLNTAIIKNMRERYGTRFILLAGGEQVRQLYLPHCSEQDEIITLQEVEELCKRTPNPDEDNKLALQNEEEFGVNYILDILQQDRAIFGTYMPYAASSWTKKKIDDLDTLNAKLNGYFDWSNKLIESKGIDLVALRPGGLMATVFIHVAMSKKIPVTMSRPSRHKSYMTWTYGAYSGHQIFEEAYNNHPEDGLEVVPLEDILPPEGSRQVFEQFKRQSSVKLLMRKLLLAVYNHTVNGYRALKAGERHRIPSLMAGLRDIVYSWYSMKTLDSISHEDLDQMCEKPFVAFLLPKEPEYTVQSLARNFSNVQAMVQQVALSLPAGYNLVVKEHSRVGYRRMAFYADLLKLPNVILCNAKVPGSVLMNRASAVTTVAGTAAIEATLLGKKAVIFAADVEYNFLPSIKTIRSFDELAPALREAVREESPEGVEKIRLSGARYLAAVADSSYDAPNTKVFDGNAPISPEETIKSVELLIHSFQIQLNHRT